MYMAENKPVLCPRKHDGKKAIKHGVLFAVAAAVITLVVTQGMIPGNRDRYAAALQQEEKQEEAASAFEADDVYPTLVAGDAKLAPFKTVGNVVTFGTYPQTSSGADQTGIEWLVLDFDGARHRALLLSRYGLDAKPYHPEYKDMTWEFCSLRQWLNNDFLNRAFSPEEQSAILMTEVDNSSAQGYSGWKSSGGNNTLDRVFLLSFAEANKYLNVTYDQRDNIEARASATSYAAKVGAHSPRSYRTADGGVSRWWWLRSPGYHQYTAALVNFDGSLYHYFLSSGSGCVRPAIWLNLESDIF